MNPTRHQADTQLRQARQDLEELDGQVAEGEIDPVTAELLRAVYQRESEEAEAALAAAATGEEHGQSTGRRLSPRMLGVIVVAVVVAGALLSVGGSVRMRAPGAPITGGFEGVARSGFDQARADFDPAAYSDESLEAVVAANADAPEIAGMRIALADRYFSRSDYQAAFPHYQAVLEADPPPSPMLLAAALSRVAWIVYDGNGETDLALGLLDRALELRPDDPFPTYLKALVLWCGTGETEVAAALLEQAVASVDSDEEARTTIEATLTALEGGRPCG